MAYTVTEPESLPTRPLMIDVRALSKAYGANVVLDNVSLQVLSGTSYALLGQNGAGKTTLIRILSTLVTADAGSASVNGSDVAADSGAVRASISLTGQHAAVDEMLTGRENLVMMGRLRRLGVRGARRRADELIGAFDLAEFAGRTVKGYSGGMRRRLDLAVSLVAEVPLLFLDEPTTGLDPVSRNQLWNEVRELGARGTTILLTTQMLDEADRLADRIGILHDGAVAAEGTPDELKERAGGELLDVTFDSAQTASAAADLLGSAVRGTVTLTASSATVSIGTDGTANAVKDVLDRLALGGFAARSLSTARPTLDDVFADLTGTTNTNNKEQAA
ncbi:ATP-binding cassette domain-containing protein [Nakamurella lactea]|uniref:ATP-binding cassette domain-containing protein n=1 Tax=Nakamurella lactea TaxID=459515 RepID=UPI001B7FE8A3|nr:ATP-binding cassette domain-containing protein [Nakamurella lactea]